MSRGQTGTSKARVTALVERYGTAALVTWFALFALVLGLFTVLARYGVDLTPMLAWIERTFGISTSVEAGGTAGWGLALSVAYVATQATKPLRIAATVLLTPLVARLAGGAARAPTAAPPAEDAADERGDA